MYTASYSEERMNNDKIIVCLVFNENDAVVARGRHGKTREGALKSAGRRYFARFREKLALHLVTPRLTPSEREKLLYSKPNQAHA